MVLGSECSYEGCLFDIVKDHPNGNVLVSSKYDGDTAAIDVFKLYP